MNCQFLHQLWDYVLSNIHLFKTETAGESKMMDANESSIWSTTNKDKTKFENETELNEQIQSISEGSEEDYEYHHINSNTFEDKFLQRGIIIRAKFWHSF